MYNNTEQLHIYNHFLLVFGLLVSGVGLRISTELRGLQWASYICWEMSLSFSISVLLDVIQAKDLKCFNTLKHFKEYTNLEIASKFLFESTSRSLHV